MKHLAYTLKVGSLLLVDSGEYSSYGVMGFFVVLQEFTVSKELQNYNEMMTKDTNALGFDNSQFLAYLLAKGLLLEISYNNLWLTQYGEASRCCFYPAVPTTKESHHARRSTT